MQTYQNKRRAPDRGAPPAQEAAPSRSELLHLSGAGAPQPMSPQLREKFEPGFGADFTNIRISRGHIPEELGVQAVAQGTDILLDESAGMDVLGHELAHVVQQAQGRVEGGFPVVENAALEHEADVMGARVASGLTAQAGPQNGFGGEAMSIAPMSAASAPAQCKIGKRKHGKKQAAAPQQAAAAPAPAQLANDDWDGLLPQAPIQWSTAPTDDSDLEEQSSRPHVNVFGSPVPANYTANVSHAEEAAAEAKMAEHYLEPFDEDMDVSELVEPKPKKKHWWSR